MSTKWARQRRLHGDPEVCVCVCVGGGGVEGGTHSLSMGRDVLTKGVLFSESFWNGVCFIVNNLGKDSNIPVWKGVHVCLETGW